MYTTVFVHAVLMKSGVPWLSVVNSPCSTMSVEDLCGRPKEFDVALILAPAFLLMVGIAVGADIEIDDFRKMKDNKIAFVIGCSCQFLAMPCCGFFIVNSVDLHSMTSGIPNPDVAAASYALGTILTWAAPGGPTSNFFTLLVGGDVSLSVAMSVCSGMPLGTAGNPPGPVVPGL